MSGAYYNELDPYAAQWLRNLIAAGHIAAGDVDERDIRLVQPGDLHGYRQCHFFAGIGVWSYALRLAGWPDDEPVWTGSCPCQSFSAAGSRGGFDDERHLWPHWFRLIREREPRTVFGEQVASKDGLAWLDFVCADMEGQGYAIAPIDLCAAGVGAPHIRQRIFFVADAGCGLLQRGRELGELSGASSQDGREAQACAVQDAARCNGETGELADAMPAGRPQGRAGAVDRPTAGSGGACILEHANGSGEDREPPGWEQPICDERGEGCGPVNGFWRDADWIYCRGFGNTPPSYRPVEPGTFPLAHGIACRMDKLRAYGNAINAEAARAFIECYRELRPCLFP